MTRKRIRIFHPRKLWTFLAAFALTVGIAVGEMNFSQSDSVHVASKISRELQASSFQAFGGAKRGVMRLNYQISFFGSKAFNPLLRVAEAPILAIVPYADEIEEQPTEEEEIANEPEPFCLWEDSESETASYKAEVLEVKMPEYIEPGEEFHVEVYVKNIGNRIWYSHFSECEGRTVVNMGTRKEQDRSTLFYERGKNTGWVGNNRVAMFEDAVAPESTASFVFSSTAPEEEGVYREYFGLVAEHLTWLDGLEFPVDIRVGEITPDDEYKLEFMKASSVYSRSLTGEANIEVDLSTQTMVLRFGETPAYTFRVSTGAWDTPTPTGTFSIMNKQELRVGGKAPHYRMPYFQMFTKFGHGLHALPFLANDGGTFWSEAFSHIGIPVSHGCIRMLPDDAVLVYEFTKIATPLVIHK